MWTQQQATTSSYFCKKNKCINLDSAAYSQLLDQNTQTQVSNQNSYVNDVANGKNMSLDLAFHIRFRQALVNLFGSARFVIGMCEYVGKVNRDIAWGYIAAAEYKTEYIKGSSNT